MSSSLDSVLRSVPNPFEDRVVHSTRRDDLLDAQEIHRDVRERIRVAVEQAATSGNGQFLVVGGQVGRGKTHLLARVRSEVTQRGHSFVEIEPLRDAQAPLLHLLRYVGNSLRTPDGGPWTVLRTPLERAFYESLLVACRARLAGPRPHSAFVSAILEEAGRYPAGRPDALSVDSFALSCYEVWPQVERALHQELLNTAPFRTSEVDAEVVRTLFRLPAGRSDLVGAWISGEVLDGEELGAIAAHGSLETEDAAWRVLRTVLRFGQHAFVLAFDQLESAVHAVGVEGVRQLFMRIGDIRDRGGPVVLLAACQQQVWSQIQEGLPQQTLQRVDYYEELHAPRPQESEALVRVRLQALDGASSARPHPLYPFDAAEVRNAYSSGADFQSARDVLRHFSLLFQRWQSSAVAPAVSGAAPTPKPESRPVSDTVKHAIDEYAGRTRVSDVTHRAERVRVLLEQVLGGAQGTGTKIGDVTVKKCAASRRGIGTRASGLELELEANGTTCRVRLEANDEPHANSPVNGMHALLATVDGREADRVFLVRREDRALTTPVAAQLASRMASVGGVLYVGDRTVLRSDATLRVLDAASAGALPDRVDRAAAMRHVWQAEMPTLDVWQRIVERSFGTGRPATPLPATPPAATSDSLAEKVLRSMNEEGPRIIEEARLVARLGVAPALLAAAVADLESRGLVRRMADRSGAPMVMLMGRTS